MELFFALDLKNFHKFSQYKVISPILIATKFSKRTDDIRISVYDDKVVNPLVTGENEISGLIEKVLPDYKEKKKWLKDNGSKLIRRFRNG